MNSLLFLCVLPAVFAFGGEQVDGGVFYDFYQSRDRNVFTTTGDLVTEKSLSCPADTNCNLLLPEIEIQSAEMTFKVEYSYPSGATEETTTVKLLNNGGEVLSIPLPTDQTEVTSGTFDFGGSPNKVQVKLEAAGAIHPLIRKVAILSDTGSPKVYDFMATSLDTMININNDGYKSISDGGFIVKVIDDFTIKSPEIPYYGGKLSLSIDASYAGSLEVLVTYGDSVTHTETLTTPTSSFDYTFTEDTQSFNFEISGTNLMSLYSAHIKFISPCVVGNCADPEQVCIVTGKNTIDCRCANGFISWDHFATCTDIDECQEDCKHHCHWDHAQCKNTDGHYECICDKGYELSGTKDSCVDIKECDAEVPPCDEPATCTEEEGSYSCSCTEQHTTYNKDSKRCEDIDECSSADYPCDRLRGTCEDKVFATDSVPYVCTCPDGFSVNHDNSNVCEDVDECSNKCNNGQSTCNNFDGGYECICDKGYIFDDTTFQCILDDPCGDADYCPDNSVCQQVGEKFECVCEDRYEKNAFGRCTAKDPCIKSGGLSACTSAHTVCVREGLTTAFECVCREGYDKVVGSTECTKTLVDECQMATDAGVHLCDTDQTCEDLDEGYECQCPSGYRMNEHFRCEDIDECEEAKCPEHSHCENSEGSYSCQCDEGYADDDTTTEKECELLGELGPWTAISSCSGSCGDDGTISVSRTCTGGEGTLPCKSNELNDVLPCSQFPCDSNFIDKPKDVCTTYAHAEVGEGHGFFDDKQAKLIAGKVYKWSLFKGRLENSLVDKSDMIDFKKQSDDLTGDIAMLGDAHDALKSHKSSLRRRYHCNGYVDREVALQDDYVGLTKKIHQYNYMKCALEVLKARTSLVNDMHVPYFSAEMKGSY